MTISLDASSSSVLVLCSSCPPWRELANDKSAGWRIGAQHEQSAHPERVQARKAEAATRRTSG